VLRLSLGLFAASLCFVGIKKIQMLRDGEIIEIRLTATVFGNWSDRGMFLYEVEPGNEDKLSSVACFGEIQEAMCYELIPVLCNSRRSNFDGYAKSVTDAQTFDVTAGVLAGTVDPSLNEYISGEAEYEYKITPPVELKSEWKEIKPDSIVFKGSKALVLEAKHAATISDANLLVRKVDFLQKYSTAPWFLKKRQAQYTALTLQPALCTVVPLSPNARSMLPASLLYLVRKGMRYVKG
jgi:hypothetical protein